MVFWTFHFRCWIGSSSSTFFHIISLANGTCPSDQSKVIRLKYINWLRSQNFRSLRQFNTYLHKIDRPLQPLKKLNASNTGDLTGEELSFELSRVTLYAGWLYFHADFNYSHMNQTTLLRRGFKFRFGKVGNSSTTRTVNKHGRFVFI